jgi:hypothetical protein
MRRVGWLIMATLSMVCALVVKKTATSHRESTSQTFGYFVNVLDYGADRTGRNETTESFVAALKAADSHGGGEVLVPPGSYLFDKGFSVPSGVTLKGSFANVPWNGHGELNGSHSVPRKGTILLVTGGGGTEEGAFITLLSDASLTGVTIFYPKQQLGQHPPDPYPWTVQLKGSNAAITDSLLLNPWNGINATLSPRHYIARVQGQPINIGLYIDQCYDIGRVENVHWHTGWRWFPKSDTFKGSGAYRHQLLHGRGFVIARTDWQYMLNTFALNYAVGYHFIRSPSPDVPGSPTASGNFVGLGADVIRNASVLVEDVKSNGILISNSEFVALCDGKDEPLCVGAERTHVVVQSSNTGSVKFLHSNFWGPVKMSAQVGGSGTVAFNDCSFLAWDCPDSTAPCLQVSIDGDTR